MIRWYDYAVAIIFAELLMIAAFTIPFMGIVIAYTAYEIGWVYGYCQWRKDMEQ
jgi:hypothetical protein